MIMNNEIKNIKIESEEKDGKSEGTKLIIKCINQLPLCLITSEL